jgi:hypothetical protein
MPRVISFLLVVLLVWDCGYPVPVFLRLAAGAEAGKPSEIVRLDGRFMAVGSAPSWSPGGNSIVYRQGDELKIRDIASGKTRLLAPLGRSPAWSAGDGRYIAFVRGRAGEEEICVCDTAGGPPQRIIPGKGPYWSSDGRTLCFCGLRKPEYYAISVDRQEPAHAIAPPGDFISGAGIPSRDGLRVARLSGDYLKIVQRTVEKSTRDWPVNREVDDMPAWSPDGRYLAYAGFRCASGVILGVLDVERDLLLRVGDDHFGCPRWSPDGNELAVVVQRNGQGEIWSIATSALKRSRPMAPACEWSAVPQAAADLIGPWHRPRGSVFAIDLSHHYTAAKIGVGEGNSLDLAAGTHLLAGIEFQVGNGMIQLQGGSVPTMPPAASGIPVHRRLVRLYILHATQYGMASHGVSEGELISEYRVRYADGDIATIPVNIGQDVRDWWSSSQQPLSRGQVAWAGTNKAVSQDYYLRLYLSTWRNPHPEKSVESIDYVVAKSKAAPFCVAITGEAPQSVARESQASGRDPNGIAGAR